ncbi:MAG: hypothetical protein LBP72_05345, partial [Dysgonamonadaceae bacterium]|nr:hypothetical protein [Dysgonamonadaceae bacterium]
IAWQGFAQEKPTNPDGVELPDGVIEWQKKYNVQLISNKDVTLYEKPGFCACEQQNRESFVKESSIVKIERNREETLVTLRIAIGWDWNWLFVDKNTCLIDSETNDRYMLRDILGVHTPGRLAVVYGLKGKTIAMTLVFPPLKKKVTTVNFYGPPNFTEAPAQHNSEGYLECGIVLEKYAKYQQAEVIY